MFLGHYQKNFNKTKGRTSIPSAYSKTLGKSAIITKGYEGSLLIIKKSDWQKIIEGVIGNNFLSGLSRQTDRFLLGNAFEFNIDSQGRCVIPKKLRQYADLNSQVIFVGVGNRIELWDQAKWDKNTKYLDQNIEKISDQLNQQLKS